MAEGVGFEPTRGISPPKRLAGARTRPLCDPSNGISCQYSRDLYSRCNATTVRVFHKRQEFGEFIPPQRVIPTAITSFPPLILPPAVIPITITSFPRRRESSGPRPTTHWWRRRSSHDSAPGLPFDLRAMAVIQLRYRQRRDRAARARWRQLIGALESRP